MFIPLHDDNPLKNLTRPYVNYGLIGVTVLVFLVTGGADSDPVHEAALSFGLVPSVVNDIRELPAQYVLIPEVATYFTYAFLHANFLHLAGNMLFLWVFGDNIEDAVGHLRYFVFYLMHPSVKLWVLLLGTFPFRLSAGYILVAWAMFQVANLFITEPGDEEIAWLAHIGGFIAGCLLILVMRRPGVALFDRNPAPDTKAQ